MFGKHKRKDAALCIMPLVERPLARSRAFGRALSRFCACPSRMLVTLVEMKRLRIGGKKGFFHMFGSGHWKQVSIFGGKSTASRCDQWPAVCFIPSHQGSDESEYISVFLCLLLCVSSFVPSHEPLPPHQSRWFWVSRVRPPCMVRGVTRSIALGLRFNCLFPS